MQKRIIEVKEYKSEGQFPIYIDAEHWTYNHLLDCREDIKLVVVEEFTPKPTVVKTQTYLIEYNYMSDGTLQVSRTNKGFPAIELLGVVTRVQLEINQQISGTMTQPDIVKRTVVED